jgi:cell division protein FtsW
MRAARAGLALRLRFWGAEEAPRAPAALDGWLLLAALALTALGVVMVHSAGALLAERRHGDLFHFLERQSLHAALGVLALLAAVLLDPRLWLRMASVLYLGVLALLVLLWAFPDLGPSAKGASRWIQVGSFSFQPAELAKVALLCLLARKIVARGDRLSSLREGYLPLLGLAAVLVVPVLAQPDFGTAMTLAAVAVAMLFAAGARLAHLGLTALAAAPVVWWLIEGTPYRRARMLAFLNPFAHRREEGYQVYESMVSFASGEWTGVGLGEGPQKLGFFPEYHNDFVLAAVSEELGLLGVAAVVVLFGVILWRGLAIARAAGDRALGLLALGATVLLGLQAVVHMGVVMALLPTKGIPLPFVSYGGTSLIVSLFLVGVLLAVGRRGRAPEVTP